MLITIYSITCNMELLENLKYVGATVNYEKRMKDHGWYKNIYPDRRLYKYMNMIPEEYWEFNILEELECDGDDIDILNYKLVNEQRWIDIVKPTLNTINAYLSYEDGLKRKNEYYHENKEEISLQRKFQFDKAIENKEYYCNQCEKGFGSENHLQRHLTGDFHRNGRKARRRFDDNNTFCYLCEYNYSSPTELCRHNEGAEIIALHQAIENHTAWQCKYCESWSLNKQALASHVSNQHRPENKLYAEFRKELLDIPKFKKARRQEVCQRYYQKKKDDEEYKTKMKDRKDETKERTAELTRIRRKKATENKTYTCDICNKSFGTSYELKIHNTGKRIIRLHEAIQNGTSATCPDCGLISMSAIQLKKHVKRFHP